MAQRTNGSLGWNLHWPKIFIFGLSIHWVNLLIILILFFEGTVALHSQFFDPTSSNLQKHLLIKQLLMLCHIVLNCFIWVLYCSNFLRHVTMLEVGRASTWIMSYLLMYLYLRVSIFSWKEEKGCRICSVGMVLWVIALIEKQVAPLSEMALSRGKVILVSAMNYRCLSLVRDEL